MNRAPDTPAAPDNRRARTGPDGSARRVVYLAQSEEPALAEKARAIATALDLEYVYRYAGYGEYPQFLERAAGAPGTPSPVQAAT